MLRRRAGSGGISPHALYATPFKQETRRRRRTLFPPPTQLDPMMQQAVSRCERRTVGTVRACTIEKEGGGHSKEGERPST